MTKYLALILFPAVVLAASEKASTSSSKQLALEQGSVEFLATTNLSAVKVSGKSTRIQAQATLEKDALTSVRATVPVESLETGLSMRDEHMRSRIFETAPGERPALQFESTAVQCQQAQDATAAQLCKVQGNLKLRNLAKPAVLECRYSPGTAADCTGSVLLSDYGIPAPSHLGVTVKDLVTIQVSVKR